MSVPPAPGLASTGPGGAPWPVTTWYGAVETEFTAVFVQDLWSTPLRTAAAHWLGPAAVHYVETMPGRKYRAVLPWLTLARPGRPVHRCLMPELLFAVFYCLDDLLDRKRVRYGTATAYAAHGRSELTRTLDAARRGLPRSGPLAGLPGDLWEECVTGMADGQSQRHALTHGTFSWERYTEAARRRTAFVGSAWADVLTAGGDPRAAAFVTTAYPWCAEAGQLRNDLRNTTARESRDGGLRHSDLGDGRLTAVSGLLWRRADPADRQWLATRVWGRGPLGAEALVRVDRMLEHYAVRSHVVLAAGRLTRRIRAALGAIEDPRVRAVWDAWLTRQLEVGVLHGYGHGRGDASVSRFRAAVAELRGPAGRTDTG
ncbi:hypothetical protein ACF09J_16795 [Streptomyces sp. NPDC014889]|uniref:hypothetical protein n=1 Tax=Streptomyces sp. NPDC014889 TaxID=3364928 RepID=UPI0037026347